MKEWYAWTVLMPRQSGKNQLSAHLEAYLLTRYQRSRVSMVKCAPTYRPQVLVSISRLSAVTSITPRTCLKRCTGTAA